MKRVITLILLMFPLAILSAAGCSKQGGSPGTSDTSDQSLTVAERNLERAIRLTDAALTHYFDKKNGMVMSRYYNPYNGTKSAEIASVWMYTSSLEAVTGIMEAAELLKDKGNSVWYDKYFEHYKTVLLDLYKGMDYYKGSFTLTSYTQSATWEVYAVNRANSPKTADVTGILNVYDDQMWLVRELFRAYKLTGYGAYLAEAENLTAYVLDGWDATLDALGNENGGITWGPGYVTKHSCSNGPMVSPLVWLSEFYKGKADQIEVGYVNSDRTRGRRKTSKSEAYLDFARKIYAYQKSHLLRADGVYADMMGGFKTGGGKPEYETVNGTKYRKNTALYDATGNAFSYNSGTMLSGASDLYRVTRDASYFTDLNALASKSFAYFAKLGGQKEGYYSYDITGFNNWFNDVLMRGYVESYPLCNDVASAVDSFQKNLDYAWDNYMYKDMLPTSLLGGWNMDKSKNNTEGMFTFAFAAEYATLSIYLTEY